MTAKQQGRIIRQYVRLICILLAFTSTKGWAQQYYFDTYSVSEGLAQSSAFKIIQDHEDNYWIGTKAGVSKFDGLEFTNFTAEDGLAQGGVRAILEDSNGKLWFGHESGGITWYDGNKFQIVKKTDAYLNTIITTIIEDADHNVWIASAESGAVMITNPDTTVDAINAVQYTGNKLSDRVPGGTLTDDGELFFVTGIAVKKFNRDSLTFEDFYVNGMPRYFSVTCLAKDREGNFWFGTQRGGLYKYNRETDSTLMFDLIKAGLKSNWVSTVFEDSFGNIWAGTWGGGIARVDTKDRVTIYDSRNGMPGSKIWMIMEDEEGNVIFGSHEHGFSAYKGDYFLSYFEEDGLVNSQVGAIEEAKDHRFWIGTNKGISIIDQSKKSIKDYNQLRGERITFIVEDKNGSMWIAAEGEGIFTSYTDGRFRYEPLLNNNIPREIITGLDVDGDNNLWLGTLDGLLYYEIDNHRISRLTQTSGLTGNEISAIFADSKNRIWIGVQGRGLTIISGQDFIVPDLGIDITPKCFTEDVNGVVWIGTEGRGVIAYDMDADTIVRHLTEKDGLLANLINLLNCDEQNNIYIGTNKGLNKYLHERGEIYTFNRKSGFIGIETKQNATCLDSDGKIWFGTVLGLTIYDPTLKQRDVIEPQTHITGLRVNYEPYPVRDNMRLSYRDNSLIFDYRCITLNPDAVQYQIMLDEIDFDWRPPGQITQVNYPSLRPGKYTFYVKARNSQGIWNDPPVSLNFQIKPPFYLSWWFILSIIFLAGFVIFMYIKIRERALKRENRILEEKVRIRTEEVVAQKEELAQKNKDITDSIRYAKRIQFAILPPKSPFPGTFIFFKPKDIVSGDFYWFSEVKGLEFTAAVDCTGHGVPGAFMSIIGHNSLNRIVNQYGIHDPGKILSALNIEVVETLKSHEEGDVYDGMDLSLISYNKAAGEVKYAGAYNSLYMVRKGELIETKADRQPIGLAGGKVKKFTTQTIKLQSGDMIYLFSDGYADQFGGEQLKKFKSKNLKELLVRISGEPVEKQRTLLDEAIEKWRGKVEQVDDILIIGRRF